MLNWIEHDLVALRPASRGGLAAATFTTIDPVARDVPTSAIDDKPATEISEDKREKTAAGCAALLVFGGADAFGIAYNDLFAIKCRPDGASYPVTHLQKSGTSDGPCARTGHSMVAIPTGAADTFAEFVVFGGATMLPDFVQYGDVWLLGVHRSCCDIPATDAKGRKIADLIRWTRPPTSGTAPSARTSHATTVVGRSMLVVGGTTASGRTGDAYLLSLDTFAWREVTMPREFVPREMASLAPLDARRAILTGGRGDDASLGDAWVFAVEDESCVVSAAAGSFTPRCCHTSTYVATTKTLLLAGGFTDGSLEHDLAVALELRDSEERDSAPAVKITSIAELRRKDAKRDSGLMIGFGHTSTSTPDGRVFTVGGIQLHDPGSTMQVFELQQP